MSGPPIDAPSPIGLPPPFGSGTLPPGATLSAQLSTGGWGRVTYALAREVPAQIRMVRTVNKAIRRAIA